MRNIWKKSLSLTVGALFVLALNAAANKKPAEKASEKAEDSTKTYAKMVEENQVLLKKIKPALVIVQYFLEYDNRGKPPQTAGYRCPNCDRFHGIDAADYVKEERPLEVPGYLVASDRVITADILVEKRFIKEIKVKLGDTAVKAEVAKYFSKKQTIMLKTVKPLKNSNPFAFAPVTEKSKGIAVSYSFDKGLWQVKLSPFKPARLVDFPEIKATFWAAPPNSVIVNPQGCVKGFTANGQISLDSSWKRAPAQWAGLTASEMDLAMDKLSKIVEGGVLRVKLVFRSPNLKQTRRYSYHDQRRIETEYNTIGLLYDSGKLFIIADLKAKETARLTDIVVYVPGRGEVNAKFVGSLKDFGALAATISQVPELKPLKLYHKPLLSNCRKLLLKANVIVSGEQLDVTFWHSWIQDFKVGWKGWLFPQLPGNNRGAFIFGRNCELLAFPITLRTKAGKEKSYSHSNEIIPSRRIAVVLDKLADNLDSNNVPTLEAEQDKLAWLGVEAQPLNADLAKANKVSKLTDSGKNGLLLTYVYPGSPAAKAGLKAGDILLRIFADGDPNPIKLTINDYGARRPFPWKFLDRIPESYFERIPTPWQSAENKLNNLLTNLGFGKKIAVKCFVNGKVVTKDFTVKQSPEHFEAAKKFTSKSLGLTVKNITYEVRRYFQMKKTSPGVIISSITPGSKAAVSGLKPYEIIIRVNGQPVMNVRSFEKLTANGQELRFEVKRMLDTRLVKIRKKR